MEYCVYDGLKLVRKISSDKIEQVKDSVLDFRYMGLRTKNEKFSLVKCENYVKIGKCIHYLVSGFDYSKSFETIQSALSAYAKEIAKNKGAVCLHQCVYGNWETLFKRTNSNVFLFGKLGNYSDISEAILDPKVENENNVVLWDYTLAKNKQYQYKAMLMSGSGKIYFASNSIPDAIYSSYINPKNAVFEGEYKIKAVEDDKLLDVGFINLHEFYKLMNVFNPDCPKFTAISA